MTPAATADEWRDNPRQSPRGDQYNTRKNTRQTQAGLRYERQLSAQGRSQRQRCTPVNVKPRSSSRSRARRS